VTRRIYTTFAAVLLAATAGLAAANQAPEAPAQAAEAAPAEQPAGDSPAYTYDPQGRRDPFLSLLHRGSASAGTKTPSRPAGISGLEASEVVLKGTMQSPTGYVALVEATDKKTYIVKTGDRLLDGTVRTITGDTMVILQNVNDPLSLEKQRELRKTLRQTDEVK
jgi:type IV pilus assembly protein PilP